MKKRLHIIALSAALVISGTATAFAADGDMDITDDSTVVYGSVIDDSSESKTSDSEQNLTDNTEKNNTDIRDGSAKGGTDADLKSADTDSISDDADEKSVTNVVSTNPEQQVIDGKKYMVNPDGTHVTGWYYMAPYGKLYLDPNDDGAAVTGVKTIEENGKSNTYIFDSNGLLRDVSGTPEIDGVKYWIRPDGTLGSGWLYLGNWKMYFDPVTYKAYTVDEGLADIDGHKYLFNKDGVMQTFAGTTIVNGGKYWFAEEGYLRSGWLDLGSWKLYFDPVTYQAATGISSINGKNYLFDGNGVLMTSGTPVYNGKKYYVKADNSLGTGWLQLGSWKFHFNETDFSADTGISEINGKRYMFNDQGVMYFAPGGTPVINGDKYWFGNDSSLRTGWLNMGNWSMYFYPDTCKAATGVSSVEGKKLLFDKNGIRITGTGMFVVNGNKYYIGDDGNVVTGWVTIGNWTMYFDPTTGAAATGVVNIDGKKLLFDENGVNIKGDGFCVVNGKKYYFVNGNVVTGWVTVNSWTMYFDPNTGAAATGLRTIDGKTYFFNSDGVRSSGRQYMNGVTYYFNADGSLIRNSWVSFNGEKIYVDGNGVGITDRSDEYPGPYYITVDRVNCVITVYAKDSSGNYSIPVRAMTCSVGLPGTPTYSGTYSVGSKYILKELMGPSYGKFTTAVAGQAGVYFHSVATSNPANPTYSVPVGEYNKLGSPASHGCIRLCVRDAKWIYEHCGYGTPIYIGDNLAMPLGKPYMVRISSSVDPTDPAA